MCDRAGAADDARWSLLSRHATSQGVVEYCACRCGGVVVLVDGRLAKVLPRAPRSAPYASGPPGPRRGRTGDRCR
ncbi:hypothetical protein [Streptomyces sp. NPDC056987]|uniref:hypothetical protein n=1 Tax=Streptomyces sp. NPDC056987 TaxID=3345988 RepID=UPI003633B28E